MAFEHLNQQRLGALRRVGIALIHQLFNIDCPRLDLTTREPFEAEGYIFSLKSRLRHSDFFYTHFLYSMVSPVLVLPIRDSIKKLRACTRSSTSGVLH